MNDSYKLPYFPVYKRPLCIRDPSIFRQNFQEKSFLVIKRLTPMYKRPPIFKVKIMNKKGSLIHGKIQYVESAPFSINTGLDPSYFVSKRCYQLLA